MCRLQFLQCEPALAGASSSVWRGAVAAHHCTRGVQLHLSLLAHNLWASVFGFQSCHLARTWTHGQKDCTMSVALPLSPDCLPVPVCTCHFISCAIASHAAFFPEFIVGFPFVHFLFSHCVCFSPLVSSQAHGPIHAAHEAAAAHRTRDICCTSLHLSSSSA